MRRCDYVKADSEDRPMFRILGAIVASLLSLAMAKLSIADVIDDLPVGHWYKVPDSKLRAVVPSPRPAGLTGPESIMIAWSGGAFDTVRDRLIVWGGGHGDYAGNELYVFDLNNLEWSRLTDPSAPSGGSDSSGVYGDGRPRSTHTYNCLSFASKTGKFYYMGLGATWPNGNHSHRAGAFDFGSNEWQSLAEKPKIGLNRSNVTAYDSQAGLIWVHAGDERQMMSYDPVADSWRTYGSWPQWPPLALYATAAISPQDRQMVAVGNGQFLVWDLQDPTSVEMPDVQGGAAIVNGQAPGFVFDNAIGKYVGWKGGVNVYTLDPNTLAWATIAPAETNAVVPTNPPGQGTYGRFQYSPSRNVFVAVNSIDQDVYIYRLSEGGALPVAAAPLPPTDLTAQ
jgi:hypothetical protein